jgi:hypothetical protein
VQNVAVKAFMSPLLVGGASLAGRRGHQVGGWLVGLPLASGPVVVVAAALALPALGVGAFAIAAPAGQAVQGPTLFALPADTGAG